MQGIGLTERPHPVDGHDDDRPSSASAQEALAMIGFGAFIGWFFLCAFDLLPASADLMDAPELLPAFLIAYFAGMFLHTLLNTFMPITLTVKWERFCAPVTAIASLMLPAFSWATQELGATNLVAVCVLALVSGGVTGSFYYLWNSLCLRIPIRNTVKYLCISLAIGCALFLGAQCIVVEDGHALLCLALALASSMLVIFLREGTQPEADLFLPSPKDGQMPKIGFGAKNRPAQAELNRRIRLVFFVFGIAFGIAWILLVSRQPLMLDPVFVVAIGGMLLLLALFRKDPVAHDRYVSMLMRICIIVIGICFLMALVLPDLPATLFLCVICGFWQVFWIIDTALLLRHAKEHAFSILKHTSTGKLSSTSGFLIGLLCAEACIKTAGYPSTLVWLSCTVLMACILCSMALFPFATSATMLGNHDAEQPEAPRRGQQAVSWHAVCQRLAAKHGLSPREAEILEHMALGRNNHVISEELVISEHTVKSHVYNIYQKLHIHSRQEMFELLERVASQP